MNLLDKVILEWSYRCKKGYPDLNNEQDLAIFESMFGFNLLLENMRSQSAKAVKHIIDRVGDEYGFVSFKSSNYKDRIGSPDIKDPEKFKQIFSNLFKIDPESIIVHAPGENPNPSSTFPSYEFETDLFGKVNIVTSTSRRGRAGKDNEDILLNNINKYILEEPINVRFTDGTKIKEHSKITQAKDSSGSTGKDQKSDIQLFSDQNRLVANISVKQDGGFRWASVGGKMRDFRDKFVTKALEGKLDQVRLDPNPEAEDRYLMIDPKTGGRVTKIVVENMPDGDEESFIFGSELPKVYIVSRTFKDSDFDFNESTGTLTVSVTHLIEDLKDVEKLNAEPVLTIQQHVKQKYGLDFRIEPASKASFGEKARAIVIDYNEVMQ